MIVDAESVSKGLVAQFKRLGYPSDARRLYQCSMSQSAPTEHCPGGVILRCEHRLCPQCVRHVQWRAFEKLKPTVRTMLAAGGGSVFLTLTAPWDWADILGPSRKLLRVIHRFNRSWAWSGRGGGLSKRVGMVYSLEFSSPQGFPVEPHLHIFLFSWDLEAVRNCSQLLQEFWRCHHPEAQEWGMDESLPGADWPGVLDYVIKGNRILPGWPDEQITAVLDLLHSGIRLRGASGLARINGGLFGKFRPSYRAASFLDK